MIAVDTSAVVAIFLREPEHGRFLDLLDDTAAVFSAVSRLEVVSVLCGRNIGATPAAVERFMSGLALRVEPVSLEQMNEAIGALLRFGKGRHPAALNIGDCFSYGLARTLRAPLLYKGNDFTRTDIDPAIRPSARRGP